MAGPLQELSEKTIENTVYPFRTDSTFNSLHAGKYQLTIKDKNNIVCTKDLIINETTDTFTDSTIENRV